METMNDGDIFSSECCVLYVDVCNGWLLGDIPTFPGHVIKRSAAVACLTVNCARAVLLYFYLRAVGRKVLWSSACVCLSVCAHFFVRKISQGPVHGSPPNLVGGSRGEPLEQVQFWC